jgi:hypothetical protein
MNPQTLERMALEYRRGQWTPGEVVLRAFEVSDSVAGALRSAVSPSAYEGLQEAARSLMASMSPDARGIGLGFVTPAAPAVFTDVPVAFVAALASNEEKA